ncbi:MAG: hypothetical protein JSS83_28405, partial [Cyanobacteria bacterium SZAS LIN-3]|nr:hypothetical protein [Cyanobacteria bacterium SZAS LIN-3]
MRFLPDLKLTQMGILMVVLPLAVQTSVLFWVKHDLDKLHEQTQELSMRRDIVGRINKMLVMSFYGFQSLMQLKMYGGEEDKASFKKYVVDMTADTNALATVMEKNAGEPATARRLRFLAHAFTDSMQKSQFSPEENNQVATIFEGMEANVKFRDSARNLFWELQDLGRVQEGIVYKTSADAEKVRSDFEQKTNAMLLLDLAALLVAAFFMRKTVRKLNVLKENTRRVGSGIHLLERLGGNDEIGELDRVLHDRVYDLNNIRAKEKQMNARLEE